LLNAPGRAANKGWLKLKQKANKQVILNGFSGFMAKQFGLSNINKRHIKKRVQSNLYPLFWVQAKCR
jgi:hypothetical protein